MEDSPKTANAACAVGVDLGVTTLATISDGTKVDGPKPRKKLMDRISRLSRSLSRKQKGSKNRAKARMRLAKLYARIAHIRKDALHKRTTYLTRNYGTIGIEDLNVCGMAKNHSLAGSILDGAFYEFRRQLEYKAARIEGSVIVADRWFPSSKTCSDCCFVLDALPLSVRAWNALAVGQTMTEM